MSLIKVLIDGPSSGVRRQEISIKRLSLTDFKLDVANGVKNTVLAKAIADFKLQDKWNNSSWAKKISKQAKRATLSDFDRFKVMTLKQKVKF